MGMSVVYILSETTVKVLYGLRHQGQIGTQIWNRNPVSWIDQVSGQVRSVVDARRIMMEGSSRPARLTYY